ncbi:hypothetical protein O7628_29340 [Micromonospora sp. WMMD956]|uniref:hypothetical protein n=1 Tax=Micromonospora TaxID=1873 RepID=UPI002416D2E1|nr:hypothetical protein [Micromonospora sp. WMMD956]MDG4819605.1 hypothetical protein [Micromonospora sp. WMMD956]
MPGKKAAARRRRPEVRESEPISRDRWLSRELVAAVVAVGVTVVGGLGLAAGQKWLGLGGDKPAPSPAPSGDPIKINKITLVPRDNDNTWVFPEAVGAQTLGQIEDEFQAYEKSSHDIMRSHGGVENGVSTVELELEGNREKAVRLTDIAIRPRCREPLTGGLFDNRPQGAAETVQVGYDLDRDPVFAQKARTDDNDMLPRLTGNYFADQKYALKRGEQATFRLSAVTRKRYCEYTFELEYLADGKPGSTTVDNQGQPFRVTALVVRGGEVDCSAYRQVYRSSGRGWVPVPKSSPCGG